MPVPLEVRPPPSAVLWLMATAIVVGIGLLVFTSSPPAPETLARVLQPHPLKVADRVPARRAECAQNLAPALSALQVP